MVRPRRLVSASEGLLAVRVVRRFIAHGGGSQAVLIAWNVLTAIFPIALALAAIGGVVLRLAGVTPDAIARQVIAVFPADVGAQDAALLDPFERRRCLGPRGLRQERA